MHLKKYEYMQSTVDRERDRERVIRKKKEKKREKSFLCNLFYNLMQDAPQIDGVVRAHQLGKIHGPGIPNAVIIHTAM